MRCGSRGLELDVYYITVVGSGGSTRCNPTSRLEGKFRPSNCYVFQKRGYPSSMGNPEIAGTARRISPEELNMWIASPRAPSEAGFGNWVKNETKFVASIPIKNLLIFEKDGLFPGKLAFIHEDTDTLVFLAPAIKECPCTREIAKSLFDCAKTEATARGISQLIGVIDGDDDHCEILKASLLDVGFVEKEQKVLYRRNLRKLLSCKEEKVLVFKGLKELDNGTLRKGMHLHHRLWDNIEEFKKSWSSHGKYWKLVFHEDRFVGLSFLELNGKEATFEHIATSPGVRGEGFGNCIFVNGLNFARSIGAMRYLDSTEVSNIPMIKIFEKNGCKKYVSRTEFVYFTNSTKDK